ncbi:hypothetical protein K435DRAFT_967897 [Dendrothele bispora CBS 962.96]|uniref:Zn(2)-C6 fungal-type domain-containing protein n=1 Tax=Dendrothele bispora (strain CBS 962.96) TaxID=1314807 RepID=A0A4S8LSF8_DENBC|nr:hypothetical protein K435DRAFT_967897 [Dendrothele bispora CBS 962.96]
MADSTASVSCDRPSASTSSISGKQNQKKSQATSCAECRRLKLKCDRVFPCSSCIRRGCANLCPNGTLEKGRRGFLKRLEQSLPSAAHRTSGDAQPGEVTSEVAMFVARDAAMSKRIQELEAALINAGIPVPGLPHSPNSVKRPNTNKRVRSAENANAPDDNGTERRDTSTSSESGDVTVGFGTLTIDPQNRSRYIGVSGGSAYLDNEIWDIAKSEQNSDGLDDLKQHGAFDTLYEALASRRDDDQLRRHLAKLPPYDEALRLSEIYFKNGSFIYEVLPREIYFNDHLPGIYGKRDVIDTHVYPNTLAVVCMVFALGQYFDLDFPASVVRQRSQEYFEAAAFALNINNHVDGALKLESIQGVQTLHMMVLYQLSLRGEEGAEAAWQLLGMISRSIQSQGFHRDGSRWDLPPRQLEERRRVFWETYIYDRLQSFTLGRPYAQSDLHYDSEMPTICDTPLPSDTDPSNSTFSHTRWHHHKFRWGIVVGHVTDVAFSVKTPTYADIMRLDREINDFYFSLPSWALCPSVTNPVDSSVWQEVFPSRSTDDPDHFTKLRGREKPEDARKNAQIHSFANMIFPVILHLHRGPFCRALMLEPQEMIRSRYEASVARVISSSTAIINVARGMFLLNPRLMSRIWYWLFHCFTAAVCQAVFVIVAPFHPLASHAFKSLQNALQLFETADGVRARAAAARMKPLMRKAASSMEAYQKLSKKKPTPKSAVGSDAADPQGRSKGHTRSDSNASTFSTDSAIAARFPESNIRKNAEEYLGATTKLVRLPDNTSSSSEPSPSPSASSNLSVLPNQQPEPLSQYHSPPSQPLQRTRKEVEDPFSIMMGLYDSKMTPGPSAPYDRGHHETYPYSVTPDAGTLYPDSEDSWGLPMESVQDLNTSTRNLGHNGGQPVFEPTLGNNSPQQNYPSGPARNTTFNSRKEMQQFLDWRTSLGFDAHAVARGGGGDTDMQRDDSQDFSPVVPDETKFPPMIGLENDPNANSSGSVPHAHGGTMNAPNGGRDFAFRYHTNQPVHVPPSGSAFPPLHPSSHFNDANGFNLNGFIQAGANAWMFESHGER